MIKAIETVYNGYRFRSRLEARWAVFFDVLGIEYQYEPEGFDLGEEGWYLPDFWLSLNDDRYNHAGYWVEIKGAKPTLSEMAKILALAVGSGHTAWLIHGPPSNCQIFYAHFRGNHGIGTDTKPDPAFKLWCWFSRFNNRNVLDPIVHKAMLAARQARFEKEARWAS